MRVFKRIALLACAIAVLCLAFSPLAAQAKSPEDVFIVKDGDWMLKSGGEPEGASGASIEEGMCWYAVDPESEDAAKGLQRGILLYDANAEKGKAYSFLPTTEEQTRVEQVFFSPDKKLMVVVCNLNRFASGLYVYDAKSLQLEKSFWGQSDGWFVDDARFAFTLVEQEIERPEQAGMWATSAALYEPAADTGYIVLKGASATENFAVTGADKNKIAITVTSVKSEKDWEDIDNQQDSEITVDVPAAG